MAHVRSVPAHTQQRCAVGGPVPCRTNRLLVRFWCRTPNCPDLAGPRYACYARALRTSTWVRACVRRPSPSNAISKQALLGAGPGEGPEGGLRQHLGSPPGRMWCFMPPLKPEVWGRALRYGMFHTSGIRTKARASRGIMPPWSTSVVLLSLRVADISLICTKPARAAVVAHSVHLFLSRPARPGLAPM